MIKVTAPGKIHLSGEHSVVYGQPALLAAINKRVTLKIEERKDNKIIIRDTSFKIKEVLTFPQIRKFSYLHPEIWRTDDRMGLVKAGIDKIYGFLQRKPTNGFIIVIESKIPVGYGLGSSAALAVSLTASVLAFEGYKFDQNLINKIAFKIEERQHGNPSGGDNTISCFGGFIAFKKTKKGYNFKQIEKNNNLPSFLLVDSDQSRESTGEMVLAVKQQIINNKLQKIKILKKMGNLTKELISNLSKSRTGQLGSLIIKNERLLEELGVVGSKAKKIIRLIEKNSGVAKVCGAGGIKEGSGMILAYHNDLNKLESVLKKRNIEYMDVSLGQKGVRIEK